MSRVHRFGSGQEIAMALPLRYTTVINSIVIIGTFFMSSQKCSTTDEGLTQRLHKQNVLGTLVFTPDQGLSWPYHLYVILKSIT